MLLTRLSVIIVSLFILNLVQAGILNNEIEQEFHSESAESAESPQTCTISDKLAKEIAGYQPIVNKIVNAILKGKYKGKTWQGLSELTDKFGPRMSGSDSLESAIDYVTESMKAAGLENVHTENATVDHWTRGFESAELISPRKQTLSILGLGSTVGTPRGGIMGDVIAVESFEEFEKLSDDQVKGKIVLWVPEWVSYGVTVQYRSKGASVASKKGAIAALVRSVTPFSINSPHTGHQTYEESVKKIPVAAVTVEDAYSMLRLYRAGKPVRVHLEMADRNMGDFVSRNTIAELQGTNPMKNESVVVISGHLDSWDVGVGAMDDGGGAMISWKALEFLKDMGLRPRRTIRTILWTGEEQGIMGANYYMNEHKPREKEEFNFFFESDIGTFEPRGLDFSGNSDAECILKEVLKLMGGPLNATEFSSPTDGGPDIEMWSTRGFPAASLLNKNEKYFWFHHSNGDSMLVEDTENLDKCAALWAAASYVVADLSINMPRDLTD